jgi:hypothetical protein
LGRGLPPGIVGSKNQAEHDHSEIETISAIAQPAEAVFSASASLEEALLAVMEGNMILGTEGEHPVGILPRSTRSITLQEGIDPASN